MILVVGDLIVDVYHRGSVRGISAETPTMVMLGKEVSVTAGGAGHIKAHIENLCNEQVALLTYPKFNSEKWEIECRVANPTIENGYWIFSRKERFVVDNYKLFQIDWINSGKHTDVTRNEMISCVNHFIREYDVSSIVVCDMGHGVIDYRIAEKISDISDVFRIPLIVSSQSSQNKSRYEFFPKADLFCMNSKEFLEFHSVFCSCSSVNEIDEYSVRHLSKMRGHDIVVTLGAEGSIACIDQNIYRNTPSVIGDIIDTCGAGDAFLSVLASTDWKKNPDSTLQFANDYAAFHCTLLGTQVKKYEKEY